MSDCEALPVGDREVILMGDRILYSHKCDRLPLSSQGKMVNLLLGISDEIGRRLRSTPYGSSRSTPYE
ncbi:hypothetical protein [Cylindrospermopsis raciborskii]|uniref:hypothetical protein n=1 Tax=Cylindrospermopsis raciborskii TaxID=77022 RepID=UPI003DA3EBC8